MERSNFDKLLKRYVTDQVTEEERVKIEAWLDVMKTDDTRDLELSKEDEEMLFKKITSNVNNIKEIKAFRPSRRNSGGGWAIRIAASLLIVSMVSFGIYFFSKNNDLLIANNSDTEKIILNDGSIVWLRGKSKLSYLEREDGTRHTELSGEALFEVAKDPNRPFVIEFGALELKVLGTSFNVKSSHDTVELEVFTGKVSLSTRSSKEAVTVLPNEKILVVGNMVYEKQSIDVAERSKLTEHTEYNMDFSNKSLKEIVFRLEEKFNVAINLKNEKIGSCRITIDLTDHSLESSLELISEILEIKYSKTGKDFTITGKGCQ